MDVLHLNRLTVLRIFWFPNGPVFWADVRFDVRQPGLIARVYGALEASGGILYRRGGIQ